MYRGVCCVIGALVIISCTDSGNNDSDGGSNREFAAPTCPDGVDTAVDFSTAFTTELGKAITEYLCPVADNDFFKVDVPIRQGIASCPTSAP